MCFSFQRLFSQLWASQLHKRKRRNGANKKGSRSRFPLMGPDQIPAVSVGSNSIPVEKQTLSVLKYKKIEFKTSWELNFKAVKFWFATDESFSVSIVFSEVFCFFCCKCKTDEVLAEATFKWTRTVKLVSFFLPLNSKTN